MVSGAHTIQINANTSVVWDYLARFENWAPYVIGFQSMRAVDETTSRWMLRGDVGVLAREVELEVTVLDWQPGSQASFSITGITEQLSGTGSFAVVAEPAQAAPDNAVAEVATTSAEPTAAPEPKPGWWQRLVRRFALRMMARARAKGARVAGDEDRPAVAVVPRAEPAAGDASTLLTFTLDVAPGGAMAPMVEMLMKPLLEPAAEDLSTQIRAHIEGAARV